MAKAMPVGTIREWENGSFIKAHDGSVFSSGWYPLSTSSTLEDIGKLCDSLANNMIHKKIPINGEKFLDHEIKGFEKPPGKEFGKYTPDDFKQYSGFGGAGRYSFRNEFSRRFMKPKLDAYEQIDNELSEANTRKGESLGKHGDQVRKEIYLTREEIQEIKTRIRSEIKHDDSYFTTEEANELKGIVQRTKEQLDQGLDFKGEEKEIYDRNIIIARSLPDKYEKLPIVKEKIKKAIGEINETFKDNWGVRESYKTFIEDSYQEYFQKYKREILIDEGARQEAIFGLKIEEDASTFYSKIFNKIKTEKDKEDFPFKELVELRFEAKYSKQVKGEWTIDTLPALEKIEEVINKLPDGHFLTNNSLAKITQQDYDGGDSGGYAWYSSSERRINLSKSMVESSSNVWGRLGKSNEFESTLMHEIGHSVSEKLGQEDSLKYKEFVVAAGWSYSQQHLKRGVTATGGVKDIPREGSQANIELLTGYAHKSAEEAFAEYYSIYGNNKKAIDSFLDTGDESSISKESFFGVDISASKYKVGDLSDKTQIEQSKKQEIDKLLRDVHLDVDNHIKIELISPWGVSVHKHDTHNYSAAGKVRYRKGWSANKMPPVITIKDGSKYEILDGVNRKEQAKIQKKMIPSISISKEMHNQLEQRGISNSDIINYVYNSKKESYVPKEISAPRKIHGLNYRGNIINVEDIKKNTNAFKKMRIIFNSEELKKAFESLYL